MMLAALLILTATGCPSDTKKEYVDQTPPTIVRAYFEDADDGRTVNAGDRIQVVFSEAVELVGADANSFITFVSSDKLAGAQVSAGANAKTVTITLVDNNTITVNGSFNPGGPWNANDPSGIDVSISTVITDNVGNLAVQTPDDATTDKGVDISGYLKPIGPKVTSASFEDINILGSVDAGDTITVTFDINLHTCGGNAAEFFNLPVSGDGFGDNAFFTENLAAGVNTIVINLGNNPVITPAGTFGPDNLTALSPSGIDIIYGLTEGTIYVPGDTSAVAEPSNAKDLEGDVADVIGPKLTAASFADNGDRGVGNGDVITLTFDETVQLANVASHDVTDSNFDLPVGVDSVGTGAYLTDNAAGDADIELVLGDGADLAIAGVFDNANLADGDPSGIGITDWAGLDLVQDVSPQNNDAQANDPVDVGGDFEPDNAGPILVSAKFFDNGNGKMDAGDYIRLTFDESVLVPGGCASLAQDETEFDFPVDGDQLGNAGAYVIPVPAQENSVDLFVGEHATFTIKDTYIVDDHTAGDPSGINIAATISVITDDSLQHNPAQVLGNAVDIGGDFIEDHIGPTLMIVTFGDNDGDRTFSEGDTLILEFDESVAKIDGHLTQTAVTDTDFYLPNGVTLGVNGGYLVDSTANDKYLEIKLLGSGADLVVAGGYNSDCVALTDPSGFGMANAALVTDTSYFINPVQTASAPDNVGVVDIEGDFVPDTTGPQLTYAFFDVNDNTLTLTFDEWVIAPPTPDNSLIENTHYGLPVTGDTLGTEPKIAKHPTEPTKVVIFVDADYSLNATGIYDSGTTGAGSPSGLYIDDMSTLVTDNSGNLNPAVGALADAIDIVGRYVEVDTLDCAAAMSQIRIKHTATTLANGCVLVLGGVDAQYHSNGALTSAEYLASGEIYDPVAGTWTDTGNMNVARGGHTATLLPDETILILGGESAVNEFLNSVEIYCPDNNSCILLPTTMHLPRYKHYAFLQQSNGKVIYGYGDAGQRDSVASFLGYYDIPSHTISGTAFGFGFWWYAPATAQFSDETLFAAGGFYKDNGSNPWEYHYEPLYLNVPNHASDNVNLLLPKRGYASAVRLTNGEILVAGGFHCDSVIQVCQLYTYTGNLTTSMENTGDLNLPRSHADMFALGTGKAFLASGFFDNGTDLILTDNIELYNPDTGTWNNSSYTMPWTGRYRAYAFIPGPDGVLDTEDDYLLITGGLPILYPTVDTRSTNEVYIYKP
jgi:hypothetical protein